MGRQRGDVENESSSQADLGYDVTLSPSLLKEAGADDAEEVVGVTFQHFLPNGLSVRVNERIATLRSLASDICKFDDMESDSDEIIPRSVIELLESNDGLVRNVIGKAIGVSDDDEEGELDEFTLEQWVDGFQSLDHEEQGELRRSLAGLEDMIFEMLVEESGGEPVEYAVEERPLPPSLRKAVEMIDRFFSTSVKYLGPLRDEPKALYPIATNVDPSDVGLRGEHTAAVFDLHREAFIRYIPTANFSTTTIREGTSLRSLEAAVTDWLSYMGVAEKVESRDLGKLGHEFKVVTADVDMPHDLTHVGVGVSQVLPILVSCLLAEYDTTLIIEQPELHLHPRVQTLLGDFFLSMTMLGKQIIVETHSEYIINRLRFRAATATSDEVTRLLKIYFVEKRGGASDFRPVNVNRYGAITDWPEGFFDQSQSEAEEILRAATRKRKAEREGETNAKRND